MRLLPAVVLASAAVQGARAISCTACKALISTLSVTAHISNGAFVTAIQAYCNLAELQDTDVCNGVTNEVGPIIAHSLRQLRVNGWSGTLFCTTVFGTCDIPAVNPYNVTLPPPTVKVIRPTSKGRTPIKVAHISDVHIDRNYTVGAYTQCSKNICCRNYADNPSSYPANETAGPYGNVKCDSPPSLATSMISAVKALSPSFSLFTGDVVEGAVWLVTNDEIVSDINTWKTQSAGLGTVYQVVGNHDMAPVNSFPRATTSTDDYNPSYVFNLETDWTANYGCYTKAVAGTNLVIISLNTQYWYKENFWLYDSADAIPDPNGIFAWLVAQLQAIETAGKRAWIIGHMPPGKADSLRDQSNYYSQIVNRYNQTIAAQFYGHSHKDEFEIAYTDYTKQNAYTASSIAYVVPALTPTSGNPSFRTYDIDPDTYEVMDYTEYYGKDSISTIILTDLKSSTYQSGPTWKSYYAARATYAPLVDAAYPATAPLDASFWHRVTQVFETNDSAFQAWYNRRDRGYSGSTCTGDCKTSQLCFLRAQRSENNCYVPDGQFGFSKRELASVDSLLKNAHGDECSDNRMSTLLQLIALGYEGIGGLPNVTAILEKTITQRSSRLLG